MRTITKEELQLEAFEFSKLIDEGNVFIHPTDTIYGLGCDATSDEAVSKLRKIKQMPTKPISVIAPNIEWIETNCVITDEAKEWIAKLPGPYTFILKLKKTDAVSTVVNHELNSLGVRMPDHWISGFVKAYGKPVCTTSANITGKAFMTDLDDLDSDIQHSLGFCIYEGEKKGRASKIVHLEGDIVNIKNR